MVDGYDSRIIKHADYEYGQTPKYSRKNKNVTDTELEDGGGNLKPSENKEPESQRIKTQKQLKKLNKPKPTKQSLPKKIPKNTSKKTAKKPNEKNVVEQKTGQSPMQIGQDDDGNYEIRVSLSEDLMNSIDLSTYKLASDLEQDQNLSGFPITSTPKAGKEVPKNIDSNR